LVAIIFYAFARGIEMCHGTPRMVCMVAKKNLAIQVGSKP
jgi:hypothetical protein